MDDASMEDAGPQKRGKITAQFSEVVISSDFDSGIEKLTVQKWEGWQSPKIIKALHTA